MAAYGICLRIEQIALLPTIGLSIAALSIIGQNNGAGKLDRVKETIRTSLFYGFIVISVGALGMFFFPISCYISLQTIPMSLKLEWGI